MKEITEKAIEANLQIFTRKVRNWQKYGINVQFHKKRWVRKANVYLEEYSEMVLSNKQQTEEHGQ